MLRRTLSDSYTRHAHALRITGANLSDLDQRLAQLAGFTRLLMRDSQFRKLLKIRGVSRLPRHIDDCLK